MSQLNKRVETLKEDIKLDTRINKKDTENKIKSGEYILTDLNK